MLPFKTLKLVWLFRFVVFWADFTARGTSKSAQVEFIVVNDSEEEASKAAHSELFATVMDDEIHLPPHPGEGFQHSLTYALIEMVRLPNCEMPFASADRRLYDEHTLSWPNPGSNAGDQVPVPIPEVPRHRGRPRGHRGTCSFCGLTGHNRVTCPTRIAEEEPTRLRPVTEGCPYPCEPDALCAACLQARRG